MANETTSAAPVAPADNTPEVPNGSAPSTTPTPAPAKVTSKTLDEMNGAELERLLAGEAPFPDDPPPPAEEVQPEAEETDETEPAEDDESTEETAEEAAAEVQEQQHAKSFRIKATDPKRAEFLKILKRNADIDPIEAAIQAGYSPKAAAEVAKVETPAPEVDRPDPTKPVKDRIAAIEAEIQANLDAYEGEKNGKLLSQLMDAKVDLREAVQNERVRAEKQSAFNAEFATHNEKAALLHPEIAKPGTRQAKLAGMFVAERNQSDPTFFNDPKWPLKAISELETEFPEHFPKRARTSAPATPAAQPAPKVQPKPSRPLGEAIPPATGASNPPNRDDLARQIRRITDPDEIGRLLARA